jgi:hypothetical protein
VDIAGTDEDFELAWMLFTRLEATGWHVTFDDLLDQPESLMSNVFKIKAQADNNRKVKYGR